MQQTYAVSITTTHTENEALLLESNLIKQLRPKYNILLKDDKSYPYVFINTQDKFPRADFYRGHCKGTGRYFGPYPSAHAVRDTVSLIQKIFLLRTCSDHFFKHRTRPCLQYQIKRCTAPCVGYVSEISYQQQVRHAILFLQGKNNAIVAELLREMQHASDQCEFEKAVKLRNTIHQLQQLQTQQSVSTPSVGDVDVFALVENLGVCCIVTVTIRGGRILGTREYFPGDAAYSNETEVLAAFITQYYLQTIHQQDLPKQVILDRRLTEQAWITSALSERFNRSMVFRVAGRRQHEQQWIEMATVNAKQVLNQYLQGQHRLMEQWQGLQKQLALSQPIKRIECFDVSHTQGEATVMSCVVFSTTGALIRDYRRYNITEVTAGDDYAALGQGLMRHYSQLKRKGRPLPELILIDGGKGQLTVACKQLAELELIMMPLLAIAKGPTRKPGFETFYLYQQAIGVKQLMLEGSALHLLQQIRDEAHRFAITGHRRLRQKKRLRSVLEEIPGVGAKRRQSLLVYFGGVVELKQARMVDIAKVPGISQGLAERIYLYLKESA